ncbi:fluoride efflux transporter CrcB [Cellulomonas sp. ES6]|uniref:fluoride efflux transporter CrcB n=1 Tax=Cellulomonas sp. ES6 TaxID=3039384 RepID=UPI00199B68C5|nr:fluoride efflux transporter CrcB [Cellulomonas sp. ES6]MBD3778702.1 fluoride efflux transporter CrcB [Micrococcales bacterium]WHP16805.1 fluoride efflux transporter CrcB [Cellulomonas sp. ES6]
MTGALLVALAGGAGAAARFWVDGTIRARGRTVLPVATVTVNVTGSFLIGLVAGAHVYLGLPATWQLLLATGFCGGYTTFSAAAVETVRLVQAGERGRAVANLLGTAVLTVAAAAAGTVVMALAGR